jgi:hypothetical protein
VIGRLPAAGIFPRDPNTLGWVSEIRLELFEVTEIAEENGRPEWITLSSEGIFNLGQFEWRYPLWSPSALSHIRIREMKAGNSRTVKLAILPSPLPPLTSTIACSSIDRTQSNLFVRSTRGFSVALRMVRCRGGRTGYTVPGISSPSDIGSSISSRILTANGPLLSFLSRYPTHNLKSPWHTTNEERLS